MEIFSISKLEMIRDMFGIQVEAYSEYDENNRIIHHKDTINGDESWWEYDDRGNIIEFMTTNGLNVHYEYDENNKNIYARSENGFEVFTKFKSNGDLIYNKSCFKDEKDFKYEYDKENRITRFIYQDGRIEEYKWD